MNWPLMRRSNAVQRARYEQVIDQRDAARSEAAQHVCKIVKLCGENDQLREELTAVRKQLGDYEAEKKRADQLQRRLDDACGLNTSQITDGRLWQHTRADKPKGAVS